MKIKRLKVRMLDEMIKGLNEECNKFENMKIKYMSKRMM